MSVKSFFAVFMLLRYCHKHHRIGDAKPTTMQVINRLPRFVTLIECDVQVTVVCRLNQVCGWPTRARDVSCLCVLLL